MTLCLNGGFDHVIRPLQYLLYLANRGGADDPEIRRYCIRTAVLGLE
jgi:hypothetical protein